ncbi:rCG41182 [Rattus norvegicus]|uniref:RCG41182 n=1 Tax=Rattus norvegicus TaxID=10116 RepID=A6KMS3_RAT|nr:rCG41182 [Rattus norvegicus]
MLTRESRGCRARICPVPDVLLPAGRQPGHHWMTPKAQMPGSTSTRGTERGVDGAES